MQTAALQLPSRLNFARENNGWEEADTDKSISLEDCI